MSEKPITGASIKAPAPRQPRVAELPTNRTLLVAEVNPNISSPDTAIEAGSLTELVKKVQNIKPIELQVDLSDVVLAEGSGAIIKDNVAVTMTYGEDPARIISDFDVESLVAKTQAGSADAPETHRRLLIRQRLVSLLIGQLLDRIANDKSLRDLLADPSKRSAIVAALEQEIIRMEPEVRKAADARTVGNTGGVV